MNEKKEIAERIKLLLAGNACIYCRTAENLQDFPACAYVGKSHEMACECCIEELTAYGDGGQD